MEQPSGLCCHSSMSVDSGSLIGRTPLDRLRGCKEGRCWVPQERSSEFFQVGLGEYHDARHGAHVWCYTHGLCNEINSSKEMRTKPPETSHRSGGQEEH